MPEQPNNKDWVEVLVAIGRIEEGIKALRESIERQDGEIRNVKQDVQDLKLDVQQLKTQRSTVRENVALGLSVVAVIAATLSAFLP